MKRLTLKTLNNAVASAFPGVEVVKGDGYFYIAGTTPEMQARVAALYSTSIAVYNVNDLTVGGWKDAVAALLAQDEDRYEFHQN